MGKFHLDGIPPMPRGVPQVEVTFDIDANGILNVSAIEKSTGRENKITITNEKGRLTKEDIERMVSEAERFKSEDEAQAKRIEAKNGLENYAFNVRNSINDEKVKGKLAEADRKTVDTAVEEALRWCVEGGVRSEGGVRRGVCVDADSCPSPPSLRCRLEEHAGAEKEEFEERQKALEGIVSPIMT